MHCYIVLSIGAILLCGFASIFAWMMFQYYKEHVCNLISRGEVIPTEFRVKPCGGSWSVQAKANGLWAFELGRLYSSRPEAEAAKVKLMESFDPTPHVEQIVYTRP